MTAETWQSQANLSLFLVLLVISILILLAINAKPATIKLASDIVGSIALIGFLAIPIARLVAMQVNATSAPDGSAE